MSSSATDRAMTVPSRQTQAAGTWVARAACLLLVAVVAAGCSRDTRRVIGLERTAPDEFRTVTRAPLTVPPDIALRPPSPGAPATAQQDPRQRAQTAVFGPGAGRGPVAVQPGGALSTAEASLLTRAGAGGVASDIRSTIDRESQSLADAERTFADRLIFWQSQPPAGAVVDPAQESRRLRENAASGRPLNEGEVPVIQRRRRAPFEGLF
jgi:hypothetical protein